MPPQPWPADLPQQFDKDGYGDSFADNRYTTQTDLGPALIRSRVSSMPRKLGGVMKLSHDQLVRLRKFWKVDTLDGKLPFLFPDPVFGYGWRKNWIPNSGYGGAVAGNPGQLPTYWSGVGYQNGIYRRVAGMGLEGGMQYVDMQFSGTPTGNGVAEVVYSTASIPAAVGQTWAQSAYLRMIAGGKTNLNKIALVMTNVPATVSQTTDFLDAINSSALIDQRFEHSWTLNTSGTTGITPKFQLWAATGIFIDVTIRMGGVQLEQSVRATDFMPTPNDANPITRFTAGGRPPQPIFLGGKTWAVSLELEIFEA